MSEKLTFNLVTPEKQIESSEVDMVVAPGTEGDFGILAGHAAFMSTIRPGALTIQEGDNRRKIFVKGGFADICADVFTLLAEEVVAQDAIQRTELESRLQSAKNDLDNAQSDVAKEAATTNILFCEAMLNDITSN